MRLLVRLVISSLRQLLIEEVVVVVRLVEVIEEDHDDVKERREEDLDAPLNGWMEGNARWRS